MRTAPRTGPDGRRLDVLADPDLIPPPGSELAVVLESAGRVDPADMDAATAVGMLEGIWAQVAHLHALQAKVLTAMTRMPEYAACAAPTPGDVGALGDVCGNDAGNSGAPDQDAGNNGGVTGADGADDADGARMRARARRHDHDPVEVVATELSAAVRISPMHAMGLVTESVALITEHPATARALDKGEIDWSRARAIMDATAQVAIASSDTRDDSGSDASDTNDQDMYDPGLNDPDPNNPDTNDLDADRLDACGGTGDPAADNAIGEIDEDATAAARAGLEAAALTRAPEQTLRQLRERLRRLVHRADPSAAERRATQARRDRKVYPPRPCGDGNATLTAVGPLADVNAVWTALDAAARHARANGTHAGDDRNLDQLRFDALTGIAWDGLRRGHLGCCAGTTCSDADRDLHEPDHRGADVDLAGHGEPDQQSRTRTAKADGGGRDGGGRDRYQHDRTEHDRTEHDRYQRDEVDGRGSVDPFAPLHRPVTDIPDITDMTGLAGRHRRPVQINVTVPLSVLLGLSDAAAELDTPTGPEPLAPSIARALAHSDDATWRRIVTDPMTGAVLDVGRSTYRPPAALIDHVTHRDRTCRFPTASTPARSCEIDHTVEYSAGGTTSDANLGSLSPTAHTHKTLHAWQLEQRHAGTFRWISPAGRIHTVEPDTQQDVHPDPLATTTTPVTAVDDDPPPF